MILIIYIHNYELCIINKACVYIDFYIKKFLYHKLPIFSGHFFDSEKNYPMINQELQ